MDRHAPNTVCEQCGNQFFKFENWKRRSKHHFCSRSCNEKFRSNIMKGIRPPQLRSTPEGHKKTGLKLRGENNPAWKGGITFRKRKGKYPSNVKYVRCPQDYILMARKDGYIMEHRLVMAKHINRTLSRDEVVHHINHDVTDNRIENLQLFQSNAEHKRFEGQTGYFKEYYSRHHNHTNRHNS
jgi:hypothetical protein